MRPPFKLFAFCFLSALFIAATYELAAAKPAPPTDTLLLVHASTGQTIAAYAWAQETPIRTDLVPDSVAFAFVLKPATKVGTIEFFTRENGVLNRLRTERSAPYSLFGDAKNTYTPYTWSRKAGFNFSLVSILWSGERNLSSSRQIETKVEFVAPPAPPLPPAPQPKPDLWVMPIQLPDGAILNIRIEIIKNTPPN